MKQAYCSDKDPPAIGAAGQQRKKNNEELNIIIGSCIGGFLLLCIILLILFFGWRYFTKFDKKSDAYKMTMVFKFYLNLHKSFYQVEIQCISAYFNTFVLVYFYIKSWVFINMIKHFIWIFYYKHENKISVNYYVKNNDYRLRVVRSMGPNSSRHEGWVKPELVN